MCPILFTAILITYRFRRSPGLKRGSSASRLLGLRVRMSPGARMFVCCDYSVSSGRGLCDGPILLLEYLYSVSVCVCVCVSECAGSRNLSKPLETEWSSTPSGKKKVLIICKLAKRKQFHQNLQVISLLKEG